MPRRGVHQDHRRCLRADQVANPTTAGDLVLPLLQLRTLPFSTAWRPRSYTGLGDDLQRKREILSAGLTEAGFEVFRPAGTYFITTDITPLGEKDGLTFCRTLPKRCGVVAIPNAVFYDDPDAGRSQVRFTFCKQDDVLQEAATRLQRW
jgi:aspartate/methionine/tyrosine aminotransferase